MAEVTTKLFFGRYRSYFMKKFYKRCFSSTKVSITPVPLNFNVYGSQVEDAGREPLLIIHGLMGSKQNWTAMAKKINRDSGRQVFCVDARNHGNSPHTPHMSYAHLAADLKQFIRSHMNVPAVVMGHSMGGRAAMHLALSHESLLSRLIVVDISPFRSSPNLNVMGSYFEALQNVKIDPEEPISKVRILADQQLAGVIEDRGVRQFLLMSIGHVGKAGNIEWKFNLKALKENFENEIAVPILNKESTSVFKKPTLILAGTQSDFIRPDEVPYIQKVFPKGKVLFLDAGHWIHVDEPYGFLKDVVSFLKTPS